MYRVNKLEGGWFKAVAAGAQGEIDITNSFQCQDWEIFTQELRRRLETDERNEQNRTGENDTLQTGGMRRLWGEGS